MLPLSAGSKQGLLRVGSARFPCLTVPMCITSVLVLLVVTTTSCLQLASQQSSLLFSALSSVVPGCVSTSPSFNGPLFIGGHQSKRETGHECDFLYAIHSTPTNEEEEKRNSVDSRSPQHVSYQINSLSISLSLLSHHLLIASLNAALRHLMIVTQSTTCFDDSNQKLLLPRPSLSTIIGIRPRQTAYLSHNRQLHVLMTSCT